MGVSLKRRARSEASPRPAYSEDPGSTDSGGTCCARRALSANGTVVRTAHRRGRVGSTPGSCSATLAHPRPSGPVACDAPGHRGRRRSLRSPRTLPTFSLPPPFGTGPSPTAVHVALSTADVRIGDRRPEIEESSPIVERMARWGRRAGDGVPLGFGTVAPAALEPLDRSDQSAAATGSGPGAAHRRSSPRSRAVRSRGTKDRARPASSHASYSASSSSEKSHMSPTAPSLEK